MRPKYELADIFRLYGEKYREHYPITCNQRKIMAAIQCCRTASLGGHSEVCDHCGTVSNSYNSCRNRHCPKCQAMTKAEWLEKRKQELLPCGYFHMVFTIPHTLNQIILSNRKCHSPYTSAGMKNCLQKIIFSVPIGYKQIP